MTKQYKDLLEVLDSAGLLSTESHPNAKSERKSIERKREVKANYAKIRKKNNYLE